jgi:hypothetical protein
MNKFLDQSSSFANCPAVGWKGKLGDADSAASTNPAKKLAKSHSVKTEPNPISPK